MKPIKHIFLLAMLLFAVAIPSSYAQRVYTPTFGPDPARENWYIFSTESTGVCNEEFTCTGSVSLNGTSALYTQFQYKEGSFPKHLSFNLAYSGKGYPRLVVLDWVCSLEPIDFSPTKDGHYLISLEKYFTGGMYDPNGIYAMDFIFLVVDEAHKDTPIWNLDQIYGSSPVWAPINGTFAFSIAATFEPSDAIPPVEIPDSNPDLDPDAGPTSADQSYIRTRTMTHKSGNTYLDKYNYFDGLGRPIQSVQAGVTPSGNDLVTIQQYDAFGREHRSWLPISIMGNNGAYVNPNTVMSKAIETYDNDQKPYSFPVYDSSPLGDILRRYGPGEAWSENHKSVQTDRLTNRSDDNTLNCIEYLYSEYSPTDTLCYIMRAGNYMDGTLDVVRTKNEDANVTLEFRDKRGNVVLNRQVLGEDTAAQLLDTYYIYDEPGNLRAVIPPMASEVICTEELWNNESSEILRKYAYLYKYDKRNRCIAKQLPGCQWSYFIYDKGNHLIFSQDGMQRQRGEWSFSIPDAFRRNVLTGVCTNNLTHGSDPLANTCVKATSAIGNGNALAGYWVNGVGLTNPTVVTANYYDNYQFLSLPGFSTADVSYTTSGLASDYLTRYGNDAQSDAYKHKGLLTGTIMGVLSNDGVSYLYSALYYDIKKRQIQARSTAHIGGVITECTAYNFIGQPLKRTLTVAGTGITTVTQNKTYNYDHAGRITSESTALNGGPEVKTAYAYDELGRMTERQSGTSTPIISEQTAYNIRGWMTSRSSDQFSMQLRYNTPQLSGALSCYSGNISEWSWRQGWGELENTYAFSYDGLSRLTAAKQYVDGVTNDRNVEKGMSYDLNGNIQTLQRYANGAIYDNFIYTYSGNQLASLSGTTAGAYAYDANGNMTHDGPNNLDLIYNRLNLTEKVMKSGSTVAKYSYLSDGTKLAATDASGNGLVYHGSLVYKKQGDDLTLESVGFDGGRFVASATSSGTSYSPHYFITDHLGSVRVIVDETGKVLERNDYYPFGMRWNNAASQISDNRYRYNGKEWQGFLNLPYIDYGARQYDPLTGRWFNPDPLAEKMREKSPYAFCSNNPIHRVDPKGMLDDEYYNSLGYKIYDTHRGDKTFVIKTHEAKGGITTQAAIDTEKQISQGNLTGDHMENVVEVESVGKMEEMRNTIKDDGSGGDSDANNREYGGIVNQAGDIANVTQGPVRSAENGFKGSVSINPDGARSIYHSHPSGTFIDNNGQLRGSSPMPSDKDHGSIGSKQGYLFQMRTQKILIFNKDGVQAIVPLTILNK